MTENINKNWGDMTSTSQEIKIIAQLIGISN